MSRICKTCGSLFKATGNEQECPTCKEGFNDIMSIIKGKDRTETVKDSKKTEAPPTTPEPSPKMTTCKMCGKEFEQTGKGRPAVNCPACREALKHEPKATAKVRHFEPEPEAKPKATPTVVVATEEDKAKLYGNIEANREVSEATTPDVSVADDKPTDTINDAVHHPAHYTLPGLTVESVDVIRAVLTPEEFKGWCKGNALKYSLRAGRKDPTKEVQDLAKAGVFLSWITGE